MSRNHWGGNPGFQLLSASLRLQIDHVIYLCLDEGQNLWDNLFWIDETRMEMLDQNDQNLNS